MTGPGGDQPGGFWEVDEVQPPHRLVFRDGFANEDGTPNTELPMTTARVTIREIGGGKTLMSIESEFPTVEAMEQLAAMGMEEGLTQAVGQIDAILAAGVRLTDELRRPHVEAMKWSAQKVMVAGHTTVDPPSGGESFLAGFVRVVEEVRRTTGCLDFAGPTERRSNERGRNRDYEADDHDTGLRRRSNAGARRAGRGRAWPIRARRMGALRQRGGDGHGPDLPAR
jgi:hypothetical protein